MVCHDPFIKPVQPKERRVLQNVFARTVSTVPQALPVCFSVDKNLSGTWWWSGWKPQVFIPAVIIRRAFIFTLVMHLLLRCPCSACFGSPFEPSEHRFTLAIRVTYLPAMAVRVSTRTTQQESEETRFVRVCRTQVIEQGGLGLSVTLITDSRWCENTVEFPKWAFLPLRFPAQHQQPKTAPTSSPACIGRYLFSAADSWPWSRLGPPSSRKQWITL
jgi:hypothetical protein